MSLRSRIVSLLFALVLCYGVGDHLFQRRTISPLFLRAEKENVARDLERVRGLIQSRVDDLAKDCRRVASLDATYAFAGGLPLPMSGLDLTHEPLDRYDVDLLCIANASGEVLWIRSRLPDRDPRQSEATPSLRGNADWDDDATGITLSQLLSDALVLNEILPEGSSPEDVYVPQDDRAGLRSSALAPLLLASEPILDSSGRAAPRGVVLMGRFLDADYRSEIEKQTQVDFDLWSMEGEAQDHVDQELLDSVTASPDAVLRMGQDLAHAYASLMDMRKSPAFLLRANVERKVSQLGGEFLSYALNSTIVAGLLLLLALVGLLQRMVLRPLSALTEHAVRIGQTEDLFSKLDLQRKDELGILSREFDNMTSRLATSRSDLVRAARAAGMSEIATGILHNVGNVLNSVNISATLVSDHLNQLNAVEDLAKVVEILEEQGDELGSFLENSEQGQHLRPFLRELSNDIADNRKVVVSEAESMTAGIEHIRELIQSQQSYAGHNSLEEPIRVEELVDEALQISYRAFSEDPDLLVERDVADIPRSLIDRHKVLEILVNLIQNSRQAMVESGQTQRRLEIGIQRVDDMIHMSVTDNGIGFDQATGESLFTMGFTTKDTGHGFGLHASANAARSMGGSLTASSPGPGQGATFQLTVPYRPAVGSEAVS